jgi:hypothetical protein
VDDPSQAPSGSRLAVVVAPSQFAGVILCIGRRSRMACTTASSPYPGQRANEALQQTRSALTTIAAALAAERRCWTDTLRPVSPATDLTGRAYLLVCSVTPGRVRSGRAVHERPVLQVDGSWLHTTVCSLEGRVLGDRRQTGSPTAECSASSTEVVPKVAGVDSGVSPFPSWSLLARSERLSSTAGRPQRPFVASTSLSILASPERLWLSAQAPQLLRDRKRDRSEEAVGLMSPPTDVAGAAIPPSLGQPSNEGMQQTRSALTPTGAALAADPWC